MSDKKTSNHNILDYEHSVHVSPAKHSEYASRTNVRKVQMPLPLPMLNCSQRSLEPDMYFGWRPQKNKIIYKTEGAKHSKGTKGKLKKRNGIALKGLKSFKHSNYK